MLTQGQVRGSFLRLAPVISAAGVQSAVSPACPFLTEVAPAVGDPGRARVRAAKGDDPLMRIRREVRWVSWGLWLACLVFCIWFFAEAITLFLQAGSW
ncbi:hypothetical protein D9753_23590 [Streptomyces dangxiongensis]|uniref:Uncharacterized protein n=1 Tax=Streptomyces dangxiongensis TaxID=1442032 RepID=A0A3G2JG35_9ACTN|nr:hypothetical protein D9753_23590 [Streptomyces dangxiongensis]